MLKKNVEKMLEKNIEKYTFPGSLKYLTSKNNFSSDTSISSILCCFLWKSEGKMLSFDKL